METSHSLKILIVDDNRSAADALARVLRKAGDEVDVAYGGAEGIAQMDERTPDLVLTDLKMEPVDGLEVLKHARSHRPPIEVMVFTAFGAVDVAVRAMRLGARDFLTKPVSVDQIAQRLDQLRQPHTSEPTPSVKAGFIAKSPITRTLFEQLRRAASVPSPVWITGEVGSGRGYAASTIHQLSTEPPEAYQVRDLGRDAPWPSAGTVVLPNVDALPEDLQRSLMRTLRHVPEGVRLIATASADGKRAIADGKLRSELYYSLAVIVAHVPPLRNRPEDILPLLEKFLFDFSTKYQRLLPEIPPNLAARLQQYPWPGNVRELMNLAERAVVLGSDVFDIEDTEPPAEGMPRLEPGFDLTLYLEGIEKRVLIEALRHCGGDRNRAGALLGVERNTLRYKLNKYGLLG